MRTILLAAASAVLTLPCNAQDLPRPSPLGRVQQVVGLTNVSVEYSRPGVKGRAIFGELVPFGQMWRLGANSPTTIDFDTPLMIEGTVVPAGKYAMVAIPEEGAWVITLNSNTELGVDERNPELDVLSVKVVPGECEFTETLTFDFQDVKDDKARLDMRWERTRVSLWIGADATKRGMANIKEALAKPDAKYGAYHASARFYLDRGLDPEQALEWAKKSTSMERKYWNTHTLALAYAANGMYKEAIAAAEESMKLADEAKAMESVRTNQAKIEEWKAKL